MTTHPHSDPSLLTSYPSHKGGVSSLAFRPYMKHLVSGGLDGSLLFWSLFCRPNLARQTQIRPYRFLGHQGEICAVAVSPLDTVVASASKDKTVRLWVPTAEGRSSVIRAHSSTIRTVAFSPNGEYLLTGSDDKTLKVWDVETELFLLTLSGHMNWVRSAEFDSSGRWVVSGGDDKTVRLWDVERHDCVHIFSAIPGMVTCTRFHPHGSCVGSSGADQAVQIWDIRSKKLIQHYAGNAGAVRSLCFHPAGNYLLSTCDDATLKIWDLREGQILYTLKGHEGAATCAEFSPTGDHFASGSQDEHVMLWKSASWRDLTCFGLNLDQCMTPSQDKKNITSQNDTHKGNRRGQDGVNLQDADSKLKLHPSGLQDSFDKQENLAPNPKSEDHTEEEMGTQKHNLDCSSSKSPVKAASRVMKLMENKDDSFCQAKSLEMRLTLQHLVSQLDILTRTISLFGERLSHTEDKVLRLQKLGPLQSTLSELGDKVSS